MGLLKVESHQLTRVAVSGGIKGPVNGTIGCFHFWVVHNSTAAGSLVEHVGMQKIAWFILCRVGSIALFSQSIHKVAIVGVGIVQSRSHEIVGLLSSGVGVGIIVANGPVIESVPISGSTTVGDTIETDGCSVDHIMVVSTVTSREFLLKARVEGSHNRDGVVVSVNDPGLVAVFWHHDGFSLARSSQMVARSWMELYIAGRIQTLDNALANSPGFSKFRNTCKTTVFDIAIQRVFGTTGS
mmetsp:Transcript_18794/g.46660  ORF Transcript_18794/g.46660 Transcript_18794/m.46660 type:complete len:241 (-) Transcript_18794:1078-1800(-)